MGLFKWTRRANKKAQVQPADVADFGTASVPLTMSDSTAFACIDKIASEFAGLNYSVYDARTRQKVRHKLLSVLRQPNMEDRHFNFFYQSAVDYFNGGVYWLKSMVDGELVSLFRLNPAQVVVRRSSRTNAKEYCCGGSVYTDRDVVYIPSRFSYSTLRGGQSIFDAAESVFRTAGELEKYTQASFSNGGLGRRVVIDVQGALPNITEEQAAQIRNNFISAYAGAQNAGKPILKKKGFEYTELGNTTDNRSAELAENRKFQEHEIAKIFGIPQELLTAGESANIENTFVLFNEFAIKPLATQFQEAVNSLLDEDRHYFEFDYNGIMKVSLQQRIDAYTRQIANGLLSPNEARAKENLPPIEAGDNHFIPVNMMPLNDETIGAYMAKQKNEAKAGAAAPEPPAAGGEHFGGGDDKQ